jgi:hypothetical protein
MAGGIAGLSLLCISRTGGMPIVLLEQKEKAGESGAEKRANKTAEETGGEKASAEAEKAC